MSKMCLLQQFLTVSHFFKGFAPILLIMSRSEDEVPHVEKPSADFIFKEM